MHACTKHISGLAVPFHHRSKEKVYAAKSGLIIRFLITKAKMPTNSEAIGEFPFFLCADEYFGSGHEA